MSLLSLTLACWECDRTRPLQDGTVRAQRVVPIEELFAANTLELFKV